MLVSSILKAINNPKPHFSILKAPTHERYESNWAAMENCTFYMIQKEGTIKHWNQDFAKVPKNHVLLPNDSDLTKLNIQFDIAISQHKFGQFQTIEPLARYFNIPLISMEHTLPDPSWKESYINKFKEMQGDLNVFITEFSAKKWLFDPKHKNTKVIHHGINTTTFNDEKSTHDDGKVLTVVNDWINRNHCCNFDTYKRVCLDNKMPVNPIGDTKGFSKAAKDIKELVENYKKASVFFNTANSSPVSTSLLEAASCGCPIVTVAHCAVPEFFTNKMNCIMSNNEDELKEGLDWCLKNPTEAKEMGKRAREMIVEKFSLETHLNNWQSLFQDCYGKGYGYNV